jgi:arylsulfatase A-like enzyme
VYLKFIPFYFFFSFLFHLVLGTPSYSAPLLRAGVLELSQNTRWVVLGIEKQQNETDETGSDFEKLGFHGIGMSHIDPKFILEIDSRGIQRVRSFELDSSSQEDTLPPILLETPQARKNKEQHFFGNISAAIGKSFGFPFSTGTALIQLKLKQRENQKKLLAYYLLELIDKSLPPYNLFPEFQTAVSSQPEKSHQFLRSLGEALLIRYHPKSNWAGIHVPKNKDGQFYEQWRAFEAGKRTKNESYFLRAANESGLNAALIGESFAYLLTPADFSSSRSSRERKKYCKLLRFDDLLCEPSGEEFSEATPKSVISFVSSTGPIHLFSFNNPEKDGKKLKSTAQLEASLEIGGSLLPFSHWITQGIYQKVNRESLEEGVGLYSDQLYSLGTLLALTESNAYEPTQAKQISYSQIRTVISRVRENYVFQSSSEVHPLNESASILASEMERRGRLLASKSLEELQKLKNRYSRGLKDLIEANSLPEVIHSPDVPEREPIILFLIDGLRPDRFRTAAEQGLMPNLNSIFVKRGIQLESYATRSLTIPSWSTIFSGKETDMTGIGSNTPMSRATQQVVDDFLNPFKDLTKAKNRKKNRAFQHLERNNPDPNGKFWIADYFQPEQTLSNYMPVVKNPKYPIKEFASHFLSHRNEYFNDSWDSPAAADIASSRHIAKLIRKDKEGKIRLVMVWFGGVDEASHYNNRLLPHAYSEIDRGIGIILTEVQKHRSLKQAKVFLMSDHGHSGGFGPFDENSTVFRSEEPPTTTGGPHLINTGFNLTQFFLGEFEGYERYQFNVGASAFEKRANSLDWVRMKSTPNVRRHPRKPKNVDLLIDYVGNNLAQVYLKGEKGWKKRHGFYELSHFLANDHDTYLNVPADLLNLRLKNLMTTHQDLARSLIDESDHHPIELFAMPLPGKKARKSADALVPSEDSTTSTREPVLVMSQRKSSEGFRFGLILTQSDHSGHDRFRYIVVQNLKQDSQGILSGKVSLDPSDDPLEYLGQSDEVGFFEKWRTDKEWIQLTRTARKPTAIFSLSRTLTLAPKFTNPKLGEVNTLIQQAVQAQTPDFIVASYPGYAFHPDTPEESDHGGLSKEEVRNSFFISSLNPKEFSSPQNLSIPIFTRDFMPTILSYAGLGRDNQDPLPQTQGESYKDLLDELLDD